MQSAFANSYFSGAVFEDPNWNWRTIDFDRDVRFANEKTAWILNAYNPDLRSFRAHGGKLIQYHGWGDAAISPRDSINFYEKVKAFLERYPDPRSDHPHEIATFYRLFMVPGMGHCWGGTGATNFGNAVIVDKTDSPEDPDHDVLSALDRWVTQGIVPDKIIATGKIGADPKNASAGTRLTRPLCAYPAVAHYKGTGDTSDATNFECVQQPDK